MMQTSNRLKEGGLIDRGKVLNFTFNNRAYKGYEGDTLASALIANGVMLTARSFRYHRPRGIFSAGVEECHGIVCVGSGASREPNVRASLQLLCEGLEATSQNVWPSLRWDLGALTGWLSRFLPVGFYYKTFQWPAWKWYENLVRGMAGVAPAPTAADTDSYDKSHAHCDVLVIGAGPAGLSAALAAVESGLRVIIADDQPEVGGSLLWSKAAIDGRTAVDWARQVTSQLESNTQVRVLRRTTVVAAWDHNYFSAVQKFPNGGNGRVIQRYWKIRAQKVILATGAIERPMVFPNNDRPGIMLANSVCQYINRYGVRPGKRVVVYTNNDSAYQTALDLHAAGARVAIVDIRAKGSAEFSQRVQDLGLALYEGFEITNTSGYFRVSEVSIGSIGGSKSQRHSLTCDLVCVSGGWSPTLHLLSQAGGKLIYQEDLACFVARSEQPLRAANIRAVGSAAGQFGLAACLESGTRAGNKTVENLLTIKTVKNNMPEVDDSHSTYDIEAYWQSSSSHRARQWVDQMHDVTSDALAVAVSEGFSSVEHLKRYTTTGMAIDQGKTANVNALGILGTLTGQSTGDTGTTTFRPPYVPVTLGALAGRETGDRAWPMRELPLHQWHCKAGGLMEDHSGWQRAACYIRAGESEAEAIDREVLATRTSVTLFDSSSLGKIEVSGPDATRFLNRMYINNVESLKTGRIRYGMMLNENGIIIDDGVFARLKDNFYLVSASSAGSAEVALAFEEWLQTEWPDLEVLVHNATTQWATLTVGGPKSRDVMASLLPEEDLSAAQFPHMSVREGSLQSVPYRLMRVSFTGEVSFELNVPASYALSIWEALLLAGEAFDIMPLGMEALEVLRTEKGYLEVGVDTDVSTNPLDVGWGVPISKKTSDFIGKRSLSRPNDLRKDRLQLVGLQAQSSQQFLPVGSHILSTGDGQPEGHITSSCISPTLKQSIAMALLKSGQSRLGEQITIDVDGDLYQADVVPLAFYDPKGERLSA